MQDTEDDLPWQCGDAKTSNERVFTLPRAGIRLCVTQSVIDRQTMFATGDGGVVWEAATATLEYLDAEYGNGALAGWRVLELGAGTGICGLACAALGASHVTLTDLQGALPLLRDNVQTSEHSEAVDVKALTWGETEIADDGARFDMVVCCDCLYQPSHYAALAATISRLNAPLTLISWQPRGKNEEAFLEQARGVGFEVEGICTPNPSEVRIARLKRALPAAGLPGGPWALVVDAQLGKQVKDLLKGRGWLSEDYRPSTVPDGLAFPILEECVADVRGALDEARRDRTELSHAVRDLRRLAVGVLPSKKPKEQQKTKALKAASTPSPSPLPAVPARSNVPADLPRRVATQPRSFGDGLSSAAGSTLPPAVAVTRVACDGENVDQAWLREHVFSTRRPAVLCGLDLGECVGGWTAERLARARCAVPTVSVHVCASPTVDLAGHRPANTPRNFVFKSMPFDQAVRRCSGGGSSYGDGKGDGEALAPLLATGERYYLRSVGLDPRRNPADFATTFPELARECSLLPTMPVSARRSPKETAERNGAAAATDTVGDDTGFDALSEARMGRGRHMERGANSGNGGKSRRELIDAAAYHSSVLRLASDDTQLWTHFDVMDNALAQVNSGASA